MTAKQHFDALINGNYNGTRTFFRPILMHFAARFNNTTYDAFASDYKVLVESNIKCLEYFDLDMVSLISDPYRETSAFGAKINFAPDTVPQCVEHIVKNIDDVKLLPHPDVYKNFRTFDRIKGAEYYQKILKGNVPVKGWVEGPLAEACDLAGVSEMLMQLYMDPDFANLLMDKCLLFAKDFAKAQINAGCDIIGIGDAICSQIDDEMYKTFVKQRHFELIDYIHSLGGKVKLHICGDINHLIPHFKEFNIDILDCDYQVNLLETRKILGANVILSGNINPVDVQEKSVEQVFNIAKNLVNSMKSEKFILAGGCELGVYTPIENIMALRKASL